MTQTSESLKEAREQHEAAKAEALTLLEAIKNQIASSNPQEIHWGHTGSMKHLATELAELQKQARRHS